jgi:hypothetical protein
VGYIGSVAPMPHHCHNAAPQLSSPVLGQWQSTVMLLILRLVSWPVHRRAIERCKAKWAESRYLP